MMNENQYQRKKEEEEDINLVNCEQQMRRMKEKQIIC